MAATVRRLGADDEAILRSISLRFKAREPEQGGSAALLARDDVVVLATLEDDEPVGFALGYILPRIDRLQGMMFIYELEVLPKHRRRGHGRAMLEQLQQLATERGLMKMFVSTGEDNEVAHTLFAAAGGERSLRGHLWFGWAESDDGW